MTAYTLTPVGPHGPLDNHAAVVHGPSLRDSLTRAELARQVARLLVENDELRREAAGVQRLQERIEAESELRVRAQQRLSRVALALATIAHQCPEADKAVVAARELIWRQADV